MDGARFGSDAAMRQTIAVTGAIGTQRRRRECSKLCLRGRVGFCRRRPRRCCRAFRRVTRKLPDGEIDFPTWSNSTAAPQNSLKFSAIFGRILTHLWPQHKGVVNLGPLPSSAALLQWRGSKRHADCAPKFAAGSSCPCGRHERLRAPTKSARPPRPRTRLRLHEHGTVHTGRRPLPGLRLRLASSYIIRVADERDFVICHARRRPVRTTVQTPGPAALAHRVR